MTENVILVTFDSLRADLGAPEGDPDSHAPTLRWMATQGVEYEYAIAPGPRTPSSMPVLFTGQSISPVSQGGGDFWERRRAVIRRHMERHRPIPAALQDRGYHTIGVTVNPWTQDTSFDRGFDEFVDINGGTLEDYGPPAFRLADTVLADSRLGDRLYWFNKREWFISWPDFYEAILDRIEHAPEPYCCWVFLLDTHQPYIVPGRDRVESTALGMYYASLRELATDGPIPGWVDARLRRAYRDSVRSIDRFLARLLRDTADDDPVVVVHSDHGEAFGEHGTYGHEQQLYEENIHVPLVVHNANRRARISDPISLRTLPDLVDTVSTEGTFEPSAFTSPFAITAVDDGHATALTTGDWKLIRGEDGDELYDLRTDPVEERNLAFSKPELREQLGKLLSQQGSHAAERTRIADAVEREVVQG